jgi:hypothetical protein
MKTLMRFFTLIYVLNLIIAGFVSAQTVSSSGTMAVSPSERAAQIQSQNQRRTSSMSSIGGSMMGSMSMSVGTVTVFLVPSASMNNQELSAINNEMNIMSNIIVDNLQQFRTNPASDASPSGPFPSGPIGISRGIRDINEIRNSFRRQTEERPAHIDGIYIQEYGAIFKTSVNFPLSDANEQKDQVTQGQSSGQNTTTSSDVPYDAQKVEKLKTVMIEALKHVSNIKALKSNESVTISIEGSGGRTSGGGYGSFSSRSGISQTVTSVQLVGPRPAVIQISSKKSDIDAFAKGELNLEKFRQKIQIISYLSFGESPRITTVTTPSTSMGIF